MASPVKRPTLELRSSKAMRLSEFVTPEALALSISGWPRAEIETAIECLIGLLDQADADTEDREPDPEYCHRDDLPGTPDDAEPDSLWLPTGRLR